MQLLSWSAVVDRLVEHHELQRQTAAVEYGFGIVRTRGAQTMALHNIGRPLRIDPAQNGTTVGAEASDIEPADSPPTLTTPLWTGHYALVTVGATG